MIRRITKRVLTIALSATMAFSSVGMTSYAAENSGLYTIEDPEMESELSATAEEGISDADSSDADTAKASGASEGDDLSKGISIEDNTDDSTGLLEDAAEDDIIESAVEEVDPEQADAETADAAGATETAPEGAVSEELDPEEDGTSELLTENSDEPEEVLEFHVGPGYENVYTDEDIEEYFRSIYTEEEMTDHPESLPDEDVEVIGEEQLLTSTATDLRSAMRARKTSFSYSASSMNAKSVLEEAMKDVDETDPKGGDYLKGNLIGYYAYGHGSGGGWSVTIELRWASYGNPASEEKKVDEKVKQIVSDLDLKSEYLTEYEKVKAIHDYLVETIEYVNDGEDGCHGTYAALVNQECVCQGYANAFTRLTREAGLASKYIIGMRINHAWNIVRVYGGTDPDRPWYNMDVTWDDPDRGSAINYGYFLMNDIEFVGHPRDDDFETDKYYSAHPISMYSWGKEDSGNASADNPEFILEGLDGEKITTTAVKKPKFIVLYRTTCYNSQSTIKSLCGNKLLKKNKVDVVAVSVDAESKDKIKSFRDNYAKGSGIKFAVVDDNTEYEIEYSYRRLLDCYEPYLPFIVMIDEHNKAQFMTSGYIAASHISRAYMPFLKDYWDPDADAKSVEIRKFADEAAAAEGSTFSKVSSGSTVKIKFGEELYLKAAAIPNKSGIQDWTDHCITEISGTESAISYDPETGHIEGVGKGTAIITFRADYNEDVTAKVKITVAAAPITAISFNKSITTLKLGATEILDLSHLPERTTDDVAGAAPIFTSSDESVVKIGTVSKLEGPGMICRVEIESVGIGTATVTAKCLGKTTTCKVTVYKEVESFELWSAAEGSRELFVGETLECMVYVSPMDATPRGGFVWTKNSDAVAMKVSDSGDRVSVTGIEPGDVEISATLDELPEPYKTQSATVHVKSADLTLDPQGGYLPEGEYAIIPGSYGKTVGALPVPERDGYLFLGWYTDTYCQGIKINSNTPIIRMVFGSEIKAYAGWKEAPEDAITIAPIEDYIYTGSAIKPTVTVYCGKELLTQGKDYTVTYKNNKNRFTLNEWDAGYVNSKGAVMAPTVIVKGKGNYSGQAVETFRILPKAMNFGEFSIDEKKIHFTYNGKVQKATPTVKFGKITLKKGTDFIYSYHDESYSALGNYTMPGKYMFEIRAVEGGNYSGSLHVDQYIERNDLISISKCKITSPKSVPYDDGKELVPEIMVKSGSTVLTKGKDYTVEALNNTEIGTATLMVRGIGACTGFKKLTFKITGTSISKAYVELAGSSFTYDGKDHEPRVTVKLKKTDAAALVEDRDYMVTYQKNRDKGKATAVITGIGRYTGTAKKTFSITAAPAQGLRVTDAGENEEIYAEYLKGGVKPEIKVTYGGMQLTQGKDYTVKFANNNKVYTLREGDAGFDAKKAPCITINCKGNYSGSRKVFFRIDASKLQNKAALIRTTAADVIAGKWKAAVSVFDSNGKKLAAGTDYDKNVLYKYVYDATMADGSTRKAGTEVDAKDIPAAGTVIAATGTGIGNYEGTVLSGAAHGLEYRVIAKDKTIASGINFKIENRQYNGVPVTITKNDISFTPSASRADFTENDFEIVPGSYISNAGKGTAKVTLHGINGYGGYKVVTFKIVAKRIK